MMKLVYILTEDYKRNKNNPKAKVVLTLYRTAHHLRGAKVRPRLISLPFLVFYKLIIEWILAIEIPAKTKIGPGLTIYHGFGLVINGDTVIGKNAILRNGTTIGHSRKNGNSPIIGNNVEIGAGVTIIGDITIGDDVVIGAGSVVVKSIESHTTVVGNPAKRI